MRRWAAKVRVGLEGLRGSDQLLLVLSLVIGALVGLVVVAFILLTGRLAARMYPPGGAGWRRILVPVLGSLSTGYLLWRYFPFARGSGIPQTKFALFVNDGRISVPHRAGEILLLLGVAGQRHRAGPRRTFGAGGRGNRVGGGAQSGTRRAAGEGAGAGGLRGCPGGGVQHAHRGGAVFARRDHGRSARLRAGLGGVELGHVVDGAAPGAGRRSSVPRLRVSTGASGRVRGSTPCWEWWADWGRWRSSSCCCDCAPGL